MRKEVLNENRVVLTNKGNILEALPLPPEKPFNNLSNINRGGKRKKNL